MIRIIDSRSGVTSVSCVSHPYILSPFWTSFWRISYLCGGKTISASSSLPEPTESRGDSQIEAPEVLFHSINRLPLLESTFGSFFSSRNSCVDVMRLCFLVSNHVLSVSCTHSCRQLLKAFQLLPPIIIPSSPLPRHYSLTPRIWNTSFQLLFPEKKKQSRAQQW